MPDAKDFAIKVTSDDPKQKKDEDKKDDSKQGSSKVNGDVKKEGEGEDLVSAKFFPDEWILNLS